MKPKYLQFCGINSFSEPAEIDFEKLLRGGIFGIFGDTGSGKTTILDSIVFALYGKIERARGGVGSDIINYGCDRAYVNFEFETESDEGRKVYRIEREIRRKNSLQKAELILIDGDRRTSIGDGKVSAVNALVQEIVGLSFEDFKKCIALPQGEFAQFVKAEKSERLKLIARLFGLEEYGEKLNARVREKYGFYLGQTQFCQGKLSGMEDVSKEAENSLKSALNESLSLQKAAEENFSRAQERYNLLRSAYEKGVRAAQVEKRLAELSARAEEISEKQQAIARYGGAAAAKKYGEEIQSLRDKILREREKSKMFEECGKSAAQKLADLEKRAETENFDAKINECGASLARAEYIKQDSELLKSKQTERDALKAEYKKFAMQAESAERELSDLAEEKRSLAAERQKAEALGDPETLLQKNFGGALLRGEYSQSFDYFGGRLEKLRADYPADGKLYFAVERELTEKQAHYRSLLEQTEEGRSPDEIFKSFQNLRETRDALTKREHRLELAEQEARRRKEEAGSKLAEITEKGARAKEEIDSLQTKINEVLGGHSDYNAFTAHLRVSVSSYEKAKQEIAGALEKARAAQNEAAAAQKECEASVKLFTENLAAAEKNLAEELEKNGFQDLTEAQGLLARYPDIRKTQEETENFQREKLSLEGQRAAYADAASVSEEELASAKEEFENFSAARQKLYSDIGVYESRLKEVSGKLTEKLLIEKQLKHFQGRLDLLEKLRSLIKGNNFMEFIASEYLSDISASASETLLKLTGGRYFIRYKQGFFVGDNYNGGELRAVFTLSGGETFLVSLSLALSLSAAIYAKSLRPIEFFFLDEGFGTLDEKLVDTVMDSLEKLKNTHFSIGLISHVEELKHRIDNKIIVVGAAEGGSSKIQINY